MKNTLNVRRFQRGVDEPAWVELLNAEYGEFASWWRGTTVEEIVREGSGVVLRCLSGRDGGPDSIAVDHVVVAIGRAPNLDFIHTGIGECVTELREAGRLHLVGDVANGTLRQAAISAGDGLRAAMEILDAADAAHRAI